MQPLLRLRTSAFTALRSRLPHTLTTAGTAVLLASTVSVVVLCSFVIRNASRVPVQDELSNFLYVFAEPRPPLAEYWNQHNEHRIPLPRLLYVLAVRNSGFDFRAPCFLNVFLLATVSGVLLFAVRRLRGSFAIADAIFPLALLGIGQYENLLWSFQIQFVSSTAIAVVAIALAAGPGLAESKSRLIGFGACGMLLPLCGANGVALAPGIGLALLFVAAGNVWGGKRFWINGLVAAIAGIAVLAVVLAYFHGLESPAHHADIHGTLRQTIVGSINLLGAGFGPLVRYLQPHPYDGITILGAVGSGLVAATGFILLRAAVNPVTRVQAIALGGVLSGFLTLAVGIAHGRSGLVNVLEVNRYVTLMLPVVVGAYVAWVAVGRSRWVPVALFALVGTTVLPNALLGVRGARTMMHSSRVVEYQIKDGMPLEFVADRNIGIYRLEPRYRRCGLELLRSKGVEPFRRASTMPPVWQEVIPLKVLRTEGVTPESTGYRVIGESGHVVFLLPRRQAVYGVILGYDGREGAMAGMPNVISWEADGKPPASAKTGVVGQLEPLASPTETRIYTNHEAETLRIDIFGSGARFTIHSITLLTLIK